MYTHSFVQEGLKFLVVLFFKRITRSMLINTDPTHTTSRRPRPVPRRTTKSSQPGTFKLLSDFVLVVTQLELIRSKGVFVSMCALTQHSYAVPGRSPLTWIMVVLALTLGTSISWIWLSDSADVVHDRSYPLMILSLGVECSDQTIVTEDESAWTEMLCSE